MISPHRGRDRTPPEIQHKTGHVPVYGSLVKPEELEQIALADTFLVTPSVFNL